MIIAVKVWVHITSNTFSKTGSDIVDANNVTFILLCVCIRVLVFTGRVKRVLLVFNDLF